MPWDWQDSLFLSFGGTGNLNGSNAERKFSAAAMSPRIDKELRPHKKVWNLTDYQVLRSSYDHNLVDFSHVRPIFLMFPQSRKPPPHYFILDKISWLAIWWALLITYTEWCENMIEVVFCESMQQLMENDDSDYKIVGNFCIAALYPVKTRSLLTKNRAYRGFCCLHDIRKDVDLVWSTLVFGNTTPLEWQSSWRGWKWAKQRPVLINIGLEVTVGGWLRERRSTSPRGSIL